MEGDDEWEDHLIVSYTPPQGCEHTLRTEQLDRIVQHTKLEVVQLVDKGPGSDLQISKSGKEELPLAVVTKIEALLNAKNLRQRHKYWNFICRDKRNNNLSLLAAVGAHVFHQNSSGEWSMFAEPGPTGYSGDIRFVLQWKQFDFVFINFEQVAVYHDGEYLKRLAHKYSGNSSYGVQGTDKYMYFFDNEKLQRCDDKLESEKFHHETWASNGDLVNFDVNNKDSCAVLFKDCISVVTPDSAKQIKFEQPVSSGSLRFLNKERIITISKLANDSGNQAVLYDMELKEIFSLSLPKETNAMNKMRLVKRAHHPTFVLLNPSTSVLLLLVTSNRVCYLDKQDTKDDSYTFACLGDGVLITGGFHRLICSRIVTNKLVLA